MGIKYYGPGEHAMGFVGFRVSVAFGGNHLQDYFSTKETKQQSEDDREFKRQHLLAQIKEAEWQAESALFQYNRFVNEDHPTTKPERGLGVHGLTCVFFLDRRKKWQAGFSIARTGNPPLRITFRTRPFSEAWRDSVDVWARENEILDEDKQRLLDNPPEPQQFIRLRRYMNEHDGFDIPVEALSPVFVEQRAELARRRALVQAQDLEIEKGAMAPLSKELQSEMTAWFESEVSTGQERR